MKHSSSTNEQVNTYIKTLESPMKALTLALRELVLAAHKDIEETIKWNCLVFKTKKNLVQTVVGKAHVTLIFFDGQALPDPDGLLEGDNKKVKNYRVSSPDFNKKALTRLVQEAVNLHS